MTTCCVPNCDSSRRRKEPGLKFYNFPWRHSYDADLRRKWLEAINRRNPDGSLWQPSKRGSMVCNKHFVGGKLSTIWSHPNSVPSIFPKVNASATNRPKRAAKLKKCVAVRDDRVEAEDDSCSVGCEINPEIGVVEEAEDSPIPDRPSQSSSPADSATRFEDCSNQMSATNCLKIRATDEYDVIIKEEPIEVDSWFVECSVDTVGTELDVEAEDPLAPDPLYVNPIGESTQREPKKLDQVAVRDPCIGKAGSSEECNGIGLLPDSAGYWKVSEKPKGDRQVMNRTAGKQFTGDAAAQAGNFRGHITHDHNSVREKVHTCFSCGFSSSRKDVLERHMMTKHVEHRWYFCKQCEFSCKTKDELKRHQQNKHGADEKPFACDVCNYRTTKPFMLRRHQNTHKTVREKPYSCFQCVYRSDRIDRLKRHMIKHTNNRLYTCKQCDYSCNTEGELNKHQRRMHGVDKSLVCSLCDYRTMFQYQLVIHMSIHTGERPFPCEYEGCHFSARTKGTLTAHHKTHEKKSENNTGDTSIPVETDPEDADEVDDEE